MGIHSIKKKTIIQQNDLHTKPLLKTWLMITSHKWRASSCFYPAFSYLYDTQPNNTEVPMRVEQKSDRGWRVQGARIFLFFPSLLFPLLLRFFFKFFHLNCRQSHPQHCHHHRANIANTNQEIGHCDWTWRQIINTLLFLTIHDQHWGLFGCTRRACNWLFAPMTTNKQPCRKQFRIWGFWSQSCKRVAFKSFQSDWIHRTLCIADCVWTVLFDLVYLVWGTRVLFRFDRSFFFLLFFILPSVCDDRSSRVG